MPTPVPGTSLQARANVGREVRGIASRLPPIRISWDLTFPHQPNAWHPFGFGFRACIVSILYLCHLEPSNSAVVSGTRFRLARSSNGHRNYLPEIRSRVRRPKLHPENKTDCNYQTRWILYSCVSEKKVGKALHHPFECKTPGSNKPHRRGFNIYLCIT